MRALATVLLALATLVGPALASQAESSEGSQAQDPQAERAARRSRAESSGWARELERELMSPYCPGRSLIECPSQQAAELRLWIAAQEEAGVPREDVEAQLFRQFGDQLRHSPRAEGFGLFAYLVPGAALLAGLGLVVVFLRRQRAGASTPVPSAPASADPELERALEEELRAS